MDEKNRTSREELDPWHRGRARALDLLGVGDGDDPARIRRAYRRLCRAHHPDTNPGDPNAQQRFIRVQRAYHCVVHGFGCEELDNKDASDTGWIEGRNDTYRTDTRWGYFAWWQDNYF